MMLAQFGGGGGSGGGQSETTLTRLTGTSGPLVGDANTHAIARWNQHVKVGNGSVVEASGRANVLTGATSTVTVTGDIDSTIRVGNQSVVISGEGNDLIIGGTSVAVRGGNGNDRIMVGDGSTVTGDQGNDIITAGSLSVVDGGTGNDTITAGVGSTIMGGDGHDTIKLEGPASGTDFTPSKIVGGEGDDTIFVSNAAADIEYSRGDGNDIIKGDLSNSTLNLKDARPTDVSFSQVTTGAGTDLVISFAGTSDTITIKSASAASNGDFLITFRGGAQATLAELMAP